MSEQYRTPARLQARISIHTRFSTNPVRLWDWVRDRAPMRDGERILEVGCGTGEFWRGDEGRPLLTDPSEGMIAAVRARHPAFRFARVSADRLPFRAGAFDRVIAHFMLYHAASVEGALREIRRALVRGGLAQIVTNSRTHMREMFDLDPAFRNASRLTDPFHEENADAHLDPVFPDREKHVYLDGLVVPEAEPIVEYLRSTVPDADYERLRRTLRDRLPLRVTKRTVLYLCRAR